MQTPKTPSTVLDFKGLGLSNDKRIYGPDRCLSILNLIIKNGVIIPRNGYHNFTTQRQTQSSSVGIKFFKSSIATKASIIAVTNIDSNLGVSIWRDSRLAGKA